MDLLQDIRSRVAARLRELAPLAAEFEELRAVAEHLGMDPEAAVSGAAQKPARQTSRPSKRARRKPRGAGDSTSGGTKAIGAQRREEVMRVVTRRPGITVAELSGELGVDRTALYRVVRRLQADGRLVKEGVRLRPA